MARIKAKPMNRVPLAPVVSGVQLKNGFRTTPPPAATIFDSATAAAFTTHPRYIYQGGSTIPQGAVPNYTGQVMFVSIIIFYSSKCKFILIYLF